MKKFFAVMAVLAVCAVAVPVWAADAPAPGATVGARFWTDIGWQVKSEEVTVNKHDAVTSNFTNLNANSYLRATFTSEDKSTGGLAELRIGSKQGDAESVGFSYMYGWWKVGNCKLVVGQDDTWIGSLAYAPRQYLGVSQSGKVLLINWGFPYSGRHAQARAEFWFSQAVGLSVGIAEADAELAPGEDFAAPAGDYYNTVPALELGLWFRTPNFMCTPAIGWSQTQIEKTSETDKSDDDYNAFIAVLPVKLTFGPFAAKVGGYYGINNDTTWGGEINGNGTLGASPRSVPVWKNNGDEEDTIQYGFWGDLGYAIGPVTPTIGGGVVNTQNDAWSKSAGYADDNNTRFALFAALPYQVTPNFDVQPEVVYFDLGDSLATGDSAGNEWLFGVAARFIF
ncbi:MAG: hypothetical protein KQJ78_16990 [Deltaproteobacteria bacterium]|nr:hypothetical protein [Deltaproteobacteria bacterium]